MRQYRNLGINLADACLQGLEPPHDGLIRACGRPARFAIQRRQVVLTVGDGDRRQRLVVGWIRVAGEKRGTLLFDPLQERALLLHHVVGRRECMTRLCQNPFLGVDTRLHHRALLDGG